jgi:hypothetical protein
VKRELQESRFRVLNNYHNDLVIRKSKWYLVLSYVLNVFLNRSGSTFTNFSFPQ